MQFLCEAEVLLASNAKKNTSLTRFAKRRKAFFLFPKIFTINWLQFGVIKKTSHVSFVISADTTVSMGYAFCYFILHAVSDFFGYTNETLGRHLGDRCPVGC